MRRERECGVLNCLLEGRPRSKHRTSCHKSPRSMLQHSVSRPLSRPLSRHGGGGGGRGQGRRGGGKLGQQPMRPPAHPFSVRPSRCWNPHLDVLGHRDSACPNRSHISPDSRSPHIPPRRGPTWPRGPHLGAIPGSRPQPPRQSSADPSPHPCALAPSPSRVLLGVWSLPAASCRPPRRPAPLPPAARTRGGQPPRPPRLRPVWGLNWNPNPPFLHRTPPLFAKKTHITM